MKTNNNISAFKTKGAKTDNVFLIVCSQSSLS